MYLSAAHLVSLAWPWRALCREHQLSNSCVAAPDATKCPNPFSLPACVRYVALTPGIRATLSNRGFQRAAARGHDAYLAAVARMYNNVECFPDIEFEVCALYLSCFEGSKSAWLS